MTSIQEQFVADPIDRSRYEEGQTLDAASLNRDADQIANGQSLHNRYAHSAGVVAGLLTLTATKVGTQFRKYKLSPGAAIDNSGRLLLVGDDHPGVDTPIDGKSETDPEFQGEKPDLDTKSALNAWLKFSQIEGPQRASSLGMTRWSEIPKLIVVPASVDMNPIIDSDSVYLGCFKNPDRPSATAPSQSQSALANPLADAEVQFFVDSDRKYVSAIGSRIESPSGESRILLGPEVPRDTRRFAVGCFDHAEDSFKDAITWETTGAIHLKTTVDISNENNSSNPSRSQQSEPATLTVTREKLALDSNDPNLDPLRLAVEFIGMNSTETKMPAECIYLAEGKVDEQPFRELRISIPDPGEKNNPQRYRCSIGTTKQCVHGPDLCLQTGFQRGILSVLADGSVEVHKNLRVYTNDRDKQPGLIIKLQPPAESTDTIPAAPVLTNALAFVPLNETGVKVQCLLSNGKLDIIAKVQNNAAAAAHSLKLYVSVIRKDDATQTPLRFTLSSKKRVTQGEIIDFAALFIESATPESRIQFPVSADFGVNPLINLLVLGVNDDNAIVQLQIDVTATPPTPT